MQSITDVFRRLSAMARMLFCGVSTPGYRGQTNFKDTLYTLTHKKACVSARYTGTPCGETFDPDTPHRLEEDAVLYKEKDRDFVILNLTDIHFSDFGYRAPFSVTAEWIIRRMIDETRPDLITLTGDLVCGPRGKNADHLSIRRITDLMESFGIPWAPVFGNHDDESTCDLNFLAQVMMRSPHCLFRKGDPAMGVGNYAVHIVQRDETGGTKLIESLLMTDSHHDQPNERQAAWIKSCCDAVNLASGNRAEIAAFMHIPLPEFEMAYRRYCHTRKQKWDEDSKGCGRLYESVCCARDKNGDPVPSDTFRAMKAAGTVRHIFCGHDHRNDFSAVYEGIRLTYTMKLGRASGYQFGFNGATVIRVGDNGIRSVTHKTVILGITQDILTVN